MDLQKIKQKLQDLETKGSGAKHTWTPTLGKHLIRMVPYLHNKDWPFIELYFYYKLKRGSILSPLSFGKPDPIQEFVDQLKSTGDKEDWKTANGLQAKSRVYMPILIRGKEEEGVKFWGFGKQIYQELLKVIDDPDYGDISHPTKGRDIVIEVSKDPTKQWSDTTVRVKPNTSDMTKSKEVLALVDQMPRIETLWTEPTYDELKIMLENYLNNSAETTTQTAPPSPEIKNLETDPFSNVSLDDLPFGEDETNDILTKSTSKKPTKSSNTPSVVKDLDSEFDDLFK